MASCHSHVYLSDDELKGLVFAYHFCLCMLIGLCHFVCIMLIGFVMFRCELKVLGPNYNLAPTPIFFNHIGPM